MSLSPGSRIGPYDVGVPIGKGGMGEVFRARDSRLKRDVALKVLPRTAVGDPERRSRFEREAQVLASLNHPSIAQVFGVEADGDSPVIVMELVEGPTLADRIEKGALPLDEALKIASQICDGLEAAHERGIVHRDLKPANIKVRPDGTIKILDFGLARVLSGDTSIDPSDSPTTLGGTMAGVILGTAAYMSPEQARGHAVDKRADIWAFGAILYEMLTGAPAFEGGSITDILANVVQGEPNWSRLPALPGRVGEVMRRCLQKNPKDRLRDIADARFEISEAGSATLKGSPYITGSGSPAHSSGATFPLHSSGATLSASPWIATTLAFVAGAGIAAAIAIVAPMLRTSTVTPPATIRTVITLPKDTTVALSRGAAIALSPDGRSLAFAGNSHGTVQLYLRPLDRFESQILAGTEGAANPFFSPDGRWIGFFADGKLKRVSLDGGAPVSIAEARTPRGEDWGANDTIFITPTNTSPVSRVAGLGGKIEAVTSLRQGELSHRWPRLLPGGSAVLFSIWNDIGWESARIAAERLDGSLRTMVVESDGGYPRYIRDAGTHGYLVYARTEGLLAAPFDESTLAVTGQAVPVADSVITNLSGGAHFDLSPSGVLAYVAGNSGESDRELAWATLDGKTTPAAQIRGLSRSWTLSNDGTRVLRTNTIGQTRDTWIDDIIHHTTSRLTNSSDRLNTEGIWSNIWSPDERWVIYGKGTPNSNIYRRPADGRDAEERLTTSAKGQVPNSISPDGKSLVYVEFDPISGADIWVMGISPASPPRPIVRTNFAETNPVVSPDGRWIAYQSNESGRFEVFVRSFPDGQQSYRISIDGGLSPMWAPSGRELFFRSADNKMMAAAVAPAAAFQSSPPRVLFDARGYENTYAVGPDGQRLLMMPLVANESAATQVNLVFTFLAELRQRVK